MVEEEETECGVLEHADSNGSNRRHKYSYNQ